MGKTVSLEVTMHQNEQVLRVLELHFWELSSSTWNHMGVYKQIATLTTLIILLTSEKKL